MKITDIIAITQIIAETLPISSSAHVFIVQFFFSHPELSQHFDHLLHGAMIIVVLVAFFKEWKAICAILYTTIVRSLIHRKPCTYIHQKTLLLCKHIITTVITANSVIIGAYAIKKSSLYQIHIIPYYPQLLLIGLLGNALILYALKKQDANTQNIKLTHKHALIIGCTQALAFLIPGISRFGSTYTMGRCCGISSRRSCEFSFLIQLPLITGAFFIDGCYKGLYLNNDNIRSIIFNPTTLITFTIATISAIYLFKWIKNTIIPQQLLWRFSWYMFIPITIVASMLFLKVS